MHTSSVVDHLPPAHPSPPRISTWVFLVSKLIFFLPYQSSEIVSIVVRGKGGRGNINWWKKKVMSLNLFLKVYIILNKNIKMSSCPHVILGQAHTHTKAPRVSQWEWLSFEYASLNSQLSVQTQNIFFWSERFYCKKEESGFGLTLVQGHFWGPSHYHTAWVSLSITNGLRTHWNLRFAEYSSRTHTASS